MKNCLLIILSFFILVSLPIQTTSAQKSSFSAKLIKSFETGDAEMLSTLLNDNVELVIPRTENFFAKQQAKSILVDFFRKNPIIDFTILHNGNKENASFLIGTLVSSKGSFRVSVFSRKVSNQSLIYQLRIEDPNE